MSVYVVKDADIGLQFNFPEPGKFDIPIIGEFKLLNDKFEKTLTTKVMEQNLESPTKEVLKLRFTRFNSVLLMTAYGPILEKFLQKHTNMQLGMHLRATFDNGFTISCEMKSTLNSRAEKMEDGKRVVEGSVDFDANAMFKYEQLYSGKYSLEIVNRDSFEFEAHPRDNRPMLKRFWEKMKYSDFSIIANSGVRVPCHKMVLEDVSTVLDEMLQMECPDTPENCMKMEASEDVVKAFLKYIYYTDVRDACDSPKIATELLELAHVYDVEMLEKAMKALLLRKADEWFDIDAVLNLLICANGKVGLECLKGRALQMVKIRKDKLNSSAVFQQILKGTGDEVTEFFKLLL